MLSPFLWKQWVCGQVNLEWPSGGSCPPWFVPCFGKRDCSLCDPWPARGAERCTLSSYAASHASSWWLIWWPAQPVRWCHTPGGLWVTSLYSPSAPLMTQLADTTPSLWIQAQSLVPSLSLVYLFVCGSFLSQTLCCRMESFLGELGLCVRSYLGLESGLKHALYSRGWVCECVLSGAHRHITHQLHTTSHTHWGRFTKTANYRYICDMCTSWGGLFSSVFTKIKKHLVPMNAIAISVTISQNVFWFRNAVAS